MSVELLRLAPGSDNLFRAYHLKKTDGSLVTGGTGTLTLINKRTGTAVAGVSWPLALTWNATAKTFETLVPHTAVVAHRAFLRANIQIDSGAGFLYYDEAEVQVRFPSEG